MGKYRELSERYKAEADGLKNLITEKELMEEVGLRAEEKDEEKVERPVELQVKAIFMR